VRNRLLEQEIDLRRAMEAVAAARRLLPPGGIVPQDYVFQAHVPGDGLAEVRLSEQCDLLPSARPFEAHPGLRFQE
jgi:predicted dithiol-disulfide oxidoreductase (DUF899 family)